MVAARVSCAPAGAHMTAMSSTTMLPSLDAGVPGAASLLRANEVMEPDHHGAVVLGEQRTAGVDADFRRRHELAGTARVLQIEDRQGEVEPVPRLGIRQPAADEDHRFG